MTVIKLHSDIIKSGFTPVDNVFLTDYLPAADGDHVKIYLTGLKALHCGEEVSVESIALSLKLTEEKVREAFLYWEKQGLIVNSKTEPVTLTYISPKNPMPKILNYDVKKYAAFVEDVTRIFPDRFMTPSELNRYFELMEFSGIEPNALLVIMEYCKRYKSDKISTAYILAVANTWIKEGVRTFKDAEEKIEELENNGEEIRMVFEALGLKSSPDIDSRDLYRKWKEDSGLEADAILTAARLLKKKGGLAKLDSLISELKKAGARTPFEIEEYGKKKKEWHKTAQNVVKGIGAYYADLDVVVDTYIRPWSELGFTENALLTLAHYSFLSNVKTLEGLNDIVKKFYKLGLVTEDSISAYVDRRVGADEEIKSLLELAGAPRYVTARDREYYEEWTSGWGLSYDLIELAAELNRGKSFPFSQINRMLLSVKDTPDVSVEVARNIFSKIASPSPEKKAMQRRDYTKDELSGIFTSLDDIEV